MQIGLSRIKERKRERGGKTRWRKNRWRLGYVFLAHWKIHHSKEGGGEKKSVQRLFVPYWQDRKGRRRPWKTTIDRKRNNMKTEQFFSNFSALQFCMICGFPWKEKPNEKWHGQFHDSLPKEGTEKKTKQKWSNIRKVAFLTFYVHFQKSLFCFLVLSCGTSWNKAQSWCLIVSKTTINHHLKEVKPFPPPYENWPTCPKK